MITKRHAVRFLSLLAVIVTLTLAAAASLPVSGAPDVPERDDPAVGRPVAPQLDPAVLAALAEGRPVEAFVSFDDRPVQAALAAERRRLGRHDADLLDLRRATLADVKRQAGPFDVVRDFPHLGVQLVRFASVDEAQEALTRPGVISIVRVGERRRLLDQSLPLINQPQAAAAGISRQASRSR